MTEHNPWKGDPSTPPAGDDVEPVEAERVPTLNELEGRPIAEQLEALTGAPIPPLTINEMHAFLNVARCMPTAAETWALSRPATCSGASAAAATKC